MLVYIALNLIKSIRRRIFRINTVPILALVEEHLGICVDLLVLWLNHLDILVFASLDAWQRFKAALDLLP